MPQPVIKQCTAVIVNYRTRQLTSTCLNLLRKNVPDLSVIVVDNGSNDDSLTYLKSQTWVTLIERDSTDEPPHIAHARALDLGLEQVKTKYMLSLHTDSFIYHQALISSMLEIANDGDAVAVGTLEQVYRSPLRQTWRGIRRFLTYWTARLLPFRRHKRPPSDYRERYLKSFCCLWQVDVLRQNHLKFDSAGQNPGYATQAMLKQSGHRLVELPPKQIFQHMDHVQSGTMTELGLHRCNKRRQKAYRSLVPAGLMRASSL